MATYNPEKQYTWDPNEVFTLSGGEFGLILNTMRMLLSTEEAQKVQMALRINATLEGIVAKGVEEGKVKEVETPTP